DPPAGACCAQEGDASVRARTDSTSGPGAPKCTVMESSLARSRRQASCHRASSALLEKRKGGLKAALASRLQRAPATRARPRAPARGRAVTDAIARPVPIVGSQQRAVLHPLDVHRTSDIAVVLEEAGEERLPGFHRAVLVDIRDHDVAPDLLAPVPRAVPRDE